MELKAPNNLLDLLDDEIIGKLWAPVIQVSFEHPHIEAETEQKYFLRFDGETRSHSDRAPLPGENPKYITMYAESKESIKKLKEDAIPRCLKAGYILSARLIRQSSITIQLPDAYRGGHKHVVLASKETVCLEPYPWAELSKEATAAIEKICGYSTQTQPQH